MKRELPNFLSSMSQWKYVEYSSFLQRRFFVVVNPGNRGWRITNTASVKSHQQQAEPAREKRTTGAEPTYAVFVRNSVYGKVSLILSPAFQPQEKNLLNTGPIRFIKDTNASAFLFDDDDDDVDILGLHTHHTRQHLTWHFYKAYSNTVW